MWLLTECISLCAATGLLETVSSRPQQTGKSYSVQHLTSSAASFKTHYIPGASVASLSLLLKKNKNLSLERNNISSLSGMSVLQIPTCPRRRRNNLTTLRELQCKTYTVIKIDLKYIVMTTYKKITITSNIKN